MFLHPVLFGERKDWSHAIYSPYTFKIFEEILVKTKFSTIVA
jgi:hypothetical protein